ncbi:MAG: glycosyltransferase [Clostridia bacterium]|nr:glycosyltransferase [Clostridia bacterium]
MSTKEKLLFLGCEMNAAGTEKSFLAFLSALDKERYDIELLLARKGGDLYHLLPDSVKVTEMPVGGEMFTLSGANAASVIFRLFVRKNPFRLFEIFPYFLRMKLNPARRSLIAMELWLRMMKKLPDHQGEYDAAVAYWGDKTMFYMIDKVKAKKKITWLHFDYANPPRSDKTYLPYFESCDGVVTVSDAVDRALKEKLPTIAHKCVEIENLIDREALCTMAETAPTYTDGYTGTRVLSVMRICRQKGFDFIPEILSRLVKNGREFRWYIVGEGTESDVAYLTSECERLGVFDRLVLLGTTPNPYGYLKDADLFVLPSRHEGKPISVEEAKAFCKPIAVGHYLSADEQLLNGELGLIADSNPEALAETVDSLLSSADLRSVLSERLAAHNRTASVKSEVEMAKFYDLMRKSPEKT